MENIIAKCIRAKEICMKQGVTSLFFRTLDTIGNRRYFRRPLQEFQKMYLPLRYGSAAPDPFKIIWINPSEIKYMIKPPMSKRLGRSYGTFIIGGEWDKEEICDNYENAGRGLIEYENYYFHQCSLEHFLEDVDWSNTTNFEKEREKSFYNSTDRVYEKIVDEGYKTQQELEDEGYDKWFSVPEYDEIKVNITRDGHFIFDDGRHRLSVAKILNLDQIPVRVLVRHKKWQERRNEIANASHIDEISDDVRRYVNHPDMVDLRSF